MSNEAIFIYDDNHPGRITSENGLHVGEHVVVFHNGKQVKLEDIIRFGDTGYVSKIELNKNKHSLSLIYDYSVDIVGSGPASDSGYTYYTDETNDTYSLSICDRAEKSHYVRYNSKKPTIKTITWKPVGRIIDGGIASRWMTDNPKIRGLTLDKVTMLGSHDAGMCKFQWDTAGATKNNTITQVCNIGQQLNLGVRYFDLRSYYRNGEFYCGHFNHTTKYIIGWQGSCGESFTDIVNEINDFCRDKKELIILDFSGPNLDISNSTSFREYDDDIWNRFYNKINEINNICQYNANLLCERIEDRKTIGDLTAEKSSVVIIDPKGKFCKKDDLKIFNSYSNSDDYAKMKADQLNKMEKEANNPNKLFLLSWTLTLQGADNVNPSKSILKLADIANSHIKEIVDNVKNTSKYPNIIHLDKIGDDAGFYITQEINALRNN